MIGRGITPYRYDNGPPPPHRLCFPVAQGRPICSFVLLLLVVRQPPSRSGFFFFVAEHFVAQCLINPRPTSGSPPLAAARLLARLVKVISCYTCCAVGGSVGGLVGRWGWCRRNVLFIGLPNGTLTGARWVCLYAPRHSVQCTRENVAVLSHFCNEADFTTFRVVLQST